MVQIHLRYGYRGYMSKEQFIPPGTYDDHDPKVKAIVAYLVGNGHATIIDPEPDVEKLTHVDFSGVDGTELIELVGVIQVDGEDEMNQKTEAEFTHWALELMLEHDITTDDMLRAFPDVDKFLKSHVEDYLANKPE